MTGPTGAGKTTLCLAAAGVLHHDYGGASSGRVALMGRDIAEYDGLAEIGRHVGVVFDDPDAQPIFTTVEEETRLGARGASPPAGGAARTDGADPRDDRDGRSPRSGAAHPLGRPEAAGRDRRDPRARDGHPDPGRADLGARRGGDAAALPDPRAAQGRGDDRADRRAQARRALRPRGPDGLPRARPDPRRGSARGAPAGRAGPRWCSTRNLRPRPFPAEGGVAPRRRPRRSSGSTGSPTPTTESRPSGGSTSRSGPGSSWP